MKQGSRMQSVKFIFLWMLTLSLFASCNGQKKAAVDSNNEEMASDTPLTLVIEGNYAPTDSVETHVITSEKGLSKFFRKINMTRKPGIPIPKVDFSKEMVIIYCAGVNGKGTRPELVITEETEAELVLSMENVKNEKKSATKVNPFSVYIMPFTTKKIRFKASE